MLLPNENELAFSAAIRQPHAPLPPDWLPPTRIAIHRNNFHAGLHSALNARFPAIRRLLGEDCFRACVHRFIELAPPRSPVLMEYGADFPGFLHSLPELSGLPYLRDVAAYEWRRHAAQHGPDGPILSAGDLLGLAPSRLANLVLDLHPTAAILQSDYPVHTIWQTNVRDTEARPIASDLPGEAVLIARPADEVLAIVLTEAEAVFVSRLSSGHALAAAIPPGFDFSTIMATLLRSGFISAYRFDNLENWN
jgi:hypothetical protein